VLYILSTSLSTQLTPQPTTAITSITSITYTVTALHSSSAQRLWQRSITTLPRANAGDARLVSGGASVYISISAPQMSGHPSTGVHGRLIALDAQAGKVRWNVEMDGANLQHLTVAPSGALLLLVDTRIETLDGPSGAPQWSSPADTNFHITQLEVTNSAVYVEQEAYFLQGSQRSDTYDSAVVRALRLTTGNELWQREVANTDRDGMLNLSRVSMQVDDQAVYLLRVGQVQETHGAVTGLFPRKTLIALSTRDGSDRWRNPTQQDNAGQNFDLFLSDQTL
jgi:outer membrane protein assembly factor BamB